MLKSSLFILFLTFNLFANDDVAPNETCLMSIKRGADTYWRCYQGVMKKVYGEEGYQTAEPREWSAMEKLVLAEENAVTGYQDSERVPNDSCSIGFSIEAKNYLKCDGGIYQFNGKSYSRVSAKDWNKKVESLFSRHDKLVVVNDMFEGCVREAYKISCPDGIYSKDKSVFDSELMKKLDEPKESKKPRSPSGASRK